MEGNDEKFNNQKKKRPRSTTNEEKLDEILKFSNSKMKTTKEKTKQRIWIEENAVNSIIRRKTGQN